MNWMTSSDSEGAEFSEGAEEAEEKEEEGDEGWAMGIWVTCLCCVRRLRGQCASLYASILR